MRDERDITNAIHEHADMVLRVCSLYFGANAEREDAFQETFVKYAQYDGVIHDEEHRRAWLIRVAKNTCKDLLKRAETRIVPTDDIDEAARPHWSAADDADARDDRAEQLAAALRKLDGKYRIVLYLKYYEGYTAAQIATMLDVPENTVYTNLARGREKLKEVLAHA